MTFDDGGGLHDLVQLSPALIRGRKRLLRRIAALTPDQRCRGAGRLAEALLDDFREVCRLGIDLSRTTRRFPNTALLPLLDNHHLEARHLLRIVARLDRRYDLGLTRAVG